MAGDCLLQITRERLLSRKLNLKLDESGSICDPNQRNQRGQCRLKSMDTDPFDSHDSQAGQPSSNAVWLQV